MDKSETGAAKAPATTITLPALLSEANAAAYLGISATTLRKLGLPRRLLRSRKLYDRRDLDAFVDELPYEGEGGQVDEAEEWLNNHG